MSKKCVAGHLDQLHLLVEKAGLRLEPGEKPAATPARSAKPNPAEEKGEEELFREAMDHVVRASWRRHTTPCEPPSAPAVRDTAQEERRLMEAAIAGEPALRVLDHPEYIEGWVGISGRRFLPGLRNAVYSIQGQIDLHGLSRGEAKLAVTEFIARMGRFQSCCVKIIHGRGINSPTDRAILKESLQGWLSNRRLARHVVAYASAPLADGGVGAIYVLLRPRT